MVTKTKQRPVLEAAGNIFKGLAFLVLLIGALGLIAALWRSEDLLPPFVNLFYSGVLAILLFAFGQLIDVVMGIEKDSRQTLDIVKELRRSDGA